MLLALALSAYILADPYSGLVGRVEGEGVCLAAREYGAEDVHHRGEAVALVAGVRPAITNHKSHHDSGFLPHF